MKQFTLYVGTELDKMHAKIDPSERNDGLTAMQEMLASKFGGYSLDEVSGGYKSTDGKLAIEKAVRVEVTADDAAEAAMRDCAVLFRDLFRQESVLLNVATVETAFI
jgi:hypothetical protein